MEDVPKMTSRELEVVKLCCEGLTSKEIAGKLNVSVRTIDTHKSNIFKKLSISSTLWSLSSMLSRPESILLRIKSF